MAEKLTREQQIINKAKAQTHTRSFNIERAVRSEGDDTRMVELSFASDEPCTHFSWAQFDYVDIKLSMDRKAMRTERLRSGAPLLADHDPRDVIGVVEKFTIDAGEGKARAMVRFSESQRGEEIYRDVTSGIRRNVSVGFSIHKLVLEEENEEGNDLYRADDWEPFELSIVSIPADISVGVGRSAEFTKNNPPPELKQMSKEIETPETPAKETEVQTRTATEEKTVSDIRNYIAFGETYGFGSEVREAALKNKDFNMDDTRMLVQDLRTKKTELDKRVSPARVISAEANTLGNALISTNEYRAIERGANQEYKIKVDTDILPNQLGRAAYSGSGDGLTGYDRVPGIVQLGQQKPTVADLFMQAQTDQNTVRYMKETSYTNTADTVEEGADKPEAGFVLEEADAAVRKVAVWTKVTDETLEDFASIRPYIDQRLGFMVRSKIDDQLLNGNGTSPNLAGLLGTSGVQTAEMTSNTALQLAIACLNAITKVRSTAGAFFEPDAIVMHPNDYEKLRGAVDGNSQFYGGGYFQGQYGTQYNDPNFMWGLRVVQTTAISEINLATPGASNKGPVVGDFKNGGAVHYRNGLSIQATNSDQDDFIMNLTTIRVEQRLALAVYSPLAFCRVINAA